MKKNDKVGFDLMNWQPDYMKSKEENERDFREKYFEAYGEYPPEASQPSE